MEKPALKIKNVNDRKELDPNVHCNNMHDKRKKSTRGKPSLTAKLRKQSLYIHYKEGKKGTCSTKSVRHGLRSTDYESSIDITTDLPLIQRSCNVLNLISDVIVQ